MISRFVRVKIVNEYGSIMSPILLKWESSDPWAITFKFDARTSWAISRDLLQEGLVWRAGSMDVIVSSTGSNTIRIDLNSPVDLEGRQRETTATVYMSRRDVMAILNKTTAIVPLGEELSHVDMDAEITRMLNA